MWTRHTKGEKKFAGGDTSAWRNGPATTLDRFYDTHGYFPACVLESLKWSKRWTPMGGNASACPSRSTTATATVYRPARFGTGANRTVGFFCNGEQLYERLSGETGIHVEPKDAVGNWIEPMNPNWRSRVLYGNNAYTYNWDVKHDLEGLFALMGGVLRRKPNWISCSGRFESCPSSSSGPRSRIRPAGRPVRHGNEPTCTSLSVQLSGLALENAETRPDAVEHVGSPTVCRHAG
jgi:hypothetical protein